MVLLSQSERNACWVRFVLKLAKIMQVFSYMDKLKVILGEKAYMAVFPKTATIEAPEEQIVINRVIGEEIMGKQLDPSDPGTQIAKNATVDPSLCQHPTLQLKPKSNKKPDGKGIHWWVCHDCAGRWERMKLKDVEPTGHVMLDKDLVTFGDFLGKTYADVWKDPIQAQHIIQTAEVQRSASTALKRLAQYLVAREKNEGWFQIPAPTLDTALEEDNLI